MFQSCRKVYQLHIIIIMQKFPYYSRYFIMASSSSLWLFGTSTECQMSAFVTCVTTSGETSILQNTTTICFRWSKRAHIQKEIACIFFIITVYSQSSNFEVCCIFLEEIIDFITKDIFQHEIFFLRRF